MWPRLLITNTLYTVVTLQHSPVFVYNFQARLVLTKVTPTKTKTSSERFPPTSFRPGPSENKSNGAQRMAQGCCVPRRAEHRARFSGVLWAEQSFKTLASRAPMSYHCWNPRDATEHPLWTTGQRPSHRRSPGPPSPLYYVLSDWVFLNN